MHLRSLSVLLAALAFTTAHANSPDQPDALLTEAWKAWEQGDQRLVEKKFNDVLAGDPSNQRAHLGLSLMYSLQRRHAEAWTSFRRATENTSDPYPYLFAVLHTPMFTEGDKTLEVKQKLAGGGDSLGILRAMASTMLGDHYERQRDIDEAREHYAAINAIVDWTVIGPFDNTSASGHLNVYPPEASYDATAKYAGKGNVPTAWFRLSAVRPDRWIDFLRYFTSDDAVYYANTFVYSPEARRVQLRIGTSGSFRMLLNDELVSEDVEELNNDLDTYIAETDLQKGWNRVLIKCGRSEIDQCNFLLRLTDAHGKPLTGVKISSEPQTYTPRPGAVARTVENFAEAFFRARIKANPDHLENYLLLARCYLRNDKAIAAELTLREALRLAPRSVILLDWQLEAYIRGRKYDEVQKTLERIYAVDPDVPSAIEYKFEQHLEAEELDQAERVLRDLERVLGDVESVLSSKVQLYNAKNQGEKVIATVLEAHRRYPSNLAFLMGRSIIDAHQTNSQDNAILMLEKHIETDYQASTVRSLASKYLNAKSNMSKWRELNEELLEIDPTASRHLYDMSSEYIATQQYDEALSLIKRAIAVCPGGSAYWARAGEIERIRGNTDAAIAAYRTALSYYPTDYDTRAKLRELQGKRSVFDQIPAPNVDSIIAASPSAEDYPDDAAAYLLDDAMRVVYEGGASESSQEYIVKLFNNNGVDNWKEYRIGYNWYSEALTVEKAVSIKPDGTEIKADIDGNHLVFKSLEPNDIIRLKWRVKNHYVGRLAGHFWDTYHFNGFYPERLVRYALVMPKDFQFRYTTQNMDVNPLITNVEDGVLYQWKQSDLPGIPQEYGMPAYNDISRALHISSIRDWAYLVDWYRDLARSKARPSFEVKEAVEGLMAGRENATTTEKIRAVYDFITENIRYSSVSFRQGSHIPQKARDVLVNRIGDCKDVATLSIAMLAELGIEAHHVLVNTRDEGLNEVVLPSIPFNHCIVGVEHGGKTQYLDLTANNYPYGSLPEGDRGAFMLHVRPGVTAPQYLTSNGEIPRNLTIAASFELRDENSLTGERQVVGSGGIAANIRGAFRDESKKDQDKAMTTSLGEEFPNARLLSFETRDIGGPLPTAGYTYRFEVPNYLDDAGSYKMLRLPWRTAVDADQALSYEHREHAYDYWPNADTIHERLVITIPDGMSPVEVPGKQTLSSPIAEYTVTYAVKGNTLTATRQYVYKKGVVSTQEYGSYKAFYNSVVKEDNRQILLKSGGHEATPAAKPGRTRRQ